MVLAHIQWAAWSELIGNVMKGPQLGSNRKTLIWMLHSNILSSKEGTHRLGDLDIRRSWVFEEVSTISWDLAFRNLHQVKKRSYPDCTQQERILGPCAFLSNRQLTLYVYSIEKKKFRLDRHNIARNYPPLC